VDNHQNNPIFTTTLHLEQTCYFSVFGFERAKYP